MSDGPRPPRRPADLMTAAMIRSFRLGPRRNKITRERDLRVPMRDGTILLADHFAPVTREPRPTVLMRCPYGRGWEYSLQARPLAERGYHVLLQSSRGTFGSGGAFRPASDEAADGQDTVGWLRSQDWFNGKLALVGPSYLAYAAWAMALDPPPELTAMALSVSPHDLAAAGFGHGPFELFNLLTWADVMANQEHFGALRMTWRTITADGRLQAGMNKLPLVATGEAIDGAGAPAWYTEWMEHPDVADSFWDGYRAGPALDRVTVPTLLVSGFHDFFAEQTMQQYRVLRRRGVPVGLTVGPWAHLSLDMGLALRETVAWLDTFADGDSTRQPPRSQPVRVWTSGTRRWRDLPDWPPADTAECALYLQAGGQLSVGEPQATTAAASTSFRYDPADPTPSFGGRVMSVRRSGSQNNRALEARADVLTFSSAQLASPVEVAGVPSVDLYLSSDHDLFDIFVRLCDVDPRGRSRNVTDQIARFSPADVTLGQVRRVTMALTDVSHVFLPGHRVRLQVSGGAHPRFARNLGVAEDPMTTTAMVPVSHHIQHSQDFPSSLVLPVVGGVGLAAAVLEVAQPGRLSIGEPAGSARNAPMEAAKPQKPPSASPAH
jgi:uncharacterized protein